ncbi:MAG: hypothetical protein K5889_02210 [Lachnospiraceae bacterium]|nr:hypothetical protein [Lachnospiraceae bacterium]
MSGLAIGLLVIGALFFVGSFFLQEKLSSSDMDEIKGLGEKEIQSILAENVNEANRQLEEILSEKLDEKLNELEVRTDKEVNDKLLSIGEFSDTVFDSMKKTHEEIMFLYQMLNDKQEKLTEMTTAIGNAQSHIRAILSSMPENGAAGAVATAPTIPATPLPKQPQDPVQNPIEVMPVVNPVPTTSPSITPNQPSALQTEGAMISPRKEEAQLEAELHAMMEKEQDTKDAPNQQQAVEALKQHINSGRAAGDSKALREQILMMHHQGYSQIEIAKKTGRGLGEIQLILELFDEGEESS